MISNNNFSFFVLTDIHHYSKKIGSSGKKYLEMSEYNQKLHAHTKELIEEAFQQICKDKTTDTILIHGDLTNNGEKVSHEEFRKMLYGLKECGKKVFLTYSTHDYKKEKNTTKGYDGDKIIEIPSFTIDDIKSYYDDFGKNQSIAFHQSTGSYVAQLSENIRLLALNDDFGYERNGYTEKTMEWIALQIQEAKKQNQYIFVMAHHPIMAASPLYGIFGKKDMIESAHKRACEFANMGINLYFSGHSHMQKIDYVLTDEGNLLYNISTSALVGYPPVYRKIELKNNQAKIKSFVMKKAKGIDTSEKSLDEFLKLKFLGMIGDFIYAGKDGEMDRVKKVARGVSIPPSKIDKHKFLIKAFSKWIYKLSYYKVLKWTQKETGLRAKDYKDLKDKKVLPVIINLIAHIYDGKPSYTPQTLEYKLIMGLMAVIDSVIKYVPFSFEKKLGYKNLSAIVQPMAYNNGFDNYNITLDFDIKKENLPSQEDNSSPYKSRKGFFIVAITAILAVISSPILLIVMLINFFSNRIKTRKKQS